MLGNTPLTSNTSTVKVESSTDFHGTVSSGTEIISSDSINKKYSNGEDKVILLTETVSNEKGDVLQSTVQRKLKSRHVSMIALGGTIGTGLFISISTPLQQAGPFGALLAMAVLGIIAFSVSQSLGEMTTLIPVSSSFTVFTKRFVSPALGCTVGYCYLLSYSIVLALEISVVGSIMRYWTDVVTVAEWNIIIWVLVVFVNFLPVGFYGEIEFWFASIKVVALFGFLIFGLCMVCGAKAVGGHRPIGFHYWSDPGAFGTGIISSNIKEARFLGFVNALITAAFSLQGIEVCAISAGEAQNPQKTMKSAINKAFFRIILFYIGSLFFIGMLVPYNDPKYATSGDFISNSPFLLAIKNCNVKILPSIFNAIILSTVISAANSDLYISSRVLYSLAVEKQAPKIFRKTTKKGAPIYAVALISLFGFLSYLQCSAGGQVAFNWLLSCTTCLGAIAWIFISFSHIRFRNVLKMRNISLNELPFISKMVGPKNIGPWIAGIAMTFIVFIQGFTAFTPWNYKTFLASYISILIFFVFWAIFHIKESITMTAKPNCSFEGKFSKCNLFNYNYVVNWQPMLIPLEDVDIDSDRVDLDESLWEANGTEGQSNSDAHFHRMKVEDEEITFTNILSKTREAPKGQRVSAFFRNFWECICNTIS